MSGSKIPSQFNEDFIKNYNKESVEGHFLEVDVECHEKLHELQNNLPFFPERIKLKDKKLVTSVFFNFFYFSLSEKIKVRVFWHCIYIIWIKVISDFESEKYHCQCYERQNKSIFQNKF